MELDEKFRRLIKELGNAINDSLSESDKVADAMARIRGAGYDLFLVLEVTIGFNKSAGASPARRTRTLRRKEIQQFHFTTDDAEFLRGLKISIDEESK
ncbi:MAG: hypothetical protein ACRD10_12925 [Terriglobia bacterium]